jgi:hypothetical protein
MRFREKEGEKMLFQENSPILMRCQSVNMDSEKTNGQKLVSEP